MLRRIWAAVRQKRLDRELSEEIELHLAMQEEEFRRGGMTAAQARAAARREFGGVAQIQEIHREWRGFPWIESTWKDFCYALRGMRRNPAFTAAAVLSLALGIGANTAVFSLFHALLLRMLPVANPHELVTLYRTGAWGQGFGSYPLYLEVAKRPDLFQGVLGRSGVEKARLGGLETAQRELVTGNYFQVLGVSPALGRLFTEDDNRTPHAHPVAVLSYDFWRARFGADPTVLGRIITVDRQPLAVIGVAARGFHGVEVERRADVWAPAMMFEGDPMEPGRHWIWMMARRRPEVSPRQIQAAMDVLLRQYLTGVYGANTNAAFRKAALAQQIEVRAGGVGLSLLREQFGQPLRVLMVAVCLVLLTACANVAHLLVGRAAARQRETAMRISLGATRGRLIRQSLVESLLLAAVGSLLGVFFASAGMRMIVRFLPASAGEPLVAVPVPTVLLFTLGVSLFCALLFGLAPAWRYSTQNAPRTSALRGGLVTAQVAFATILAVLAALFGQSLAALRGVDLGFRNQNVIACTLDFTLLVKPSERQGIRDRFVEQLEALPGVTAVSYGFPGPFLGGFSRVGVYIRGAEVKEPVWVSVQTAAPRYFEILGASIVAGREFDHGDTATSRPVAIVNETFLRKYLPGESRVVDRILTFGGFGDKRNVYVVGVVRDIPHRGLRMPVEPTVYVPVTQKDDQEWTILVRTETPPATLSAAMRRELAKLSPEVGTWSEPKTIRSRIDESIYRERLLATLGWLFGGLALGLAAVGLYGLVVYAAAQRAREIAIRLALGASRQRVVWIVMRSPLLLIAAGLAVGLPGAVLAARQISAVLFGVRPGDPATYAVTACVLFATGLSAAMAPARRAVSLDPNRILRQD